MLTPEVVTPPEGTAAAAVTPPAPSWRDTLPEDIRGVPELQKYASLADLAKGHVEQSKLVGRKGVGVPGLDAKPEDIAAYRKALGVPDSPDKYEITPHPAMALPDWNQATQAEFLKAAHADGFTPKQVQTAIGFYADYVAKGRQEMHNIEAEDRAKLRQEWGPNYEAYLGAAHRGLTRVAHEIGVDPESMRQAVKGVDPYAVTKAFHWMESQFVEHGMVQGEPIGGKTPEEAVTKIAELRKQMAALPEGHKDIGGIIEQIVQWTKVKNSGRAA